MTSSQTETVQAFLDAVGRRDVTAALAVVAPQAVVTVHPARASRGHGPGVLGPRWMTWSGRFPDLLVTPARVITTGDVVTALIKVEGTQAADYAGAINQEKHLDIDQAWRFAVTGGLITGVAAYWCQQQLYRRLAVKRFDAISIA